MASSKASASEHGGIGTLELIGVLGVSLVFAWFFLCAFNLAEAAVGSDAYTARIGALLAFFAAVLAGAGISWRWSSDFVDSFRKKPFLVGRIIFAMVLPLYAVLALSGVLLPKMPAACACSFMAGVAFPAFLASYQDLSCRMRSQRFTRFNWLSMSVAIALYLLVSCFVGAQFQGIFALLFAIAAGVLIPYADRIAEPRLFDDFTAMQARFKLDPKIGIVYFLFNAVYGIGWSLAICATSREINIIFGAMLAVCLVLLMLLGGKVDMRDNYVVTLIQVVLAVLALSLGILAALPSLYGVALCLICLLWEPMWVVNDGILIQHCIDFDLHVPYHTGQPKTAGSAGFALGVLGTLAMAATSPASMTSPTLLLPMLLAVVVAAGALLLPINRSSDCFFEVEEPLPLTSAGGAAMHVLLSDEALATAISYEQALAEICERLSKMYQLSRRESEMLPYLARGRNAKYIASEMVVSEYTTRTHIYHIYKKMDVHSHQELIDLVEAHHQTR